METLLLDTTTLITLGNIASVKECNNKLCLKKDVKLPRCKSCLSVYMSKMLTCFFNFIADNWPSFVQCIQMPIF